MSRDAEKKEFRMSLSVSGGGSWSCEAQKGYWVKKETTLSITRRFDDDEPDQTSSRRRMRCISTPPSAAMARRGTPPARSPSRSVRAWA